MSIELAEPKNARRTRRVRPEVLVVEIPQSVLRALEQSRLYDRPDAAGDGGERIIIQLPASSAFLYNEPNAEAEVARRFKTLDKPQIQTAASYLKEIVKAHRRQNRAPSWATNY